MANHVVTHSDGKQYRREFVTGRRALPFEIKSRHKTISLSPLYYEMAVKWKDNHGINFSSWIEDKMREENKKVCTETV